VPFHGLGSDQVEKATIPSSGVEAYYVSEHKYADALALHERLLAFTKEETEEVAIILFVSPTSISEESPWFSVFSTLARRGLISVFCVDKAYSLEQAGRSFHTEFGMAGKGITQLCALMPGNAPLVAMSASMRQCDRKTITTMLGGGMKPALMHGSLARRGTMFSCHVSGQSSKTFKKSAEKF